MTLFRDRIQSAFKDENARRKDAGEPRLTKTDLWKAAKLTSAAATFWFDGANAADLDTCMKIAPLMGVRGQWLFDGVGPKHPTNDEGSEDHAPVHLLLDVVIEAGKGRPVYSEDETKTLMFRRDWLRKHGIKKERDAACVEVQGRSMVDAGIPDGSIVIINLQQKDPAPKKIYAVRTENGPIIKQLVRDGDLWVARSCNEEEKNKYPDLIIGPEARIIGRAFWCGFGL